MKCDPRQIPRQPQGGTRLGLRRNQPAELAAVLCVVSDLRRAASRIVLAPQPHALTRGGRGRRPNHLRRDRQFAEVTEV